MKSFQSLLPVFGLVAAAQAWGSDWNETQVVTTTTITTDIYTTFCPEATTFTQGTKTYTATASETITITDCPCTYVTTGKPTNGTSKPTTTVVPPPVWTTTTITTDIYSTYCPVPTTFTQGSKTYTVTEATTLTITECPCTYVTSTTCPPTSTPTWVAPPPPPKNATASISYLTTYCPQPTVVTISNMTYSLSSGTQTIPFVTAPITIGTISPSKTPVGPTSAITTGPLQVTGAANHFELGAGAMAAGLAALLL